MHIKAFEYIYIYLYIYMIYILEVNPTRRDILYSVPPEALRVAVAGQQHSSG
jgi:hypothetical protein